MRLFISYARVDKPYCIQIVNMLDVHDIWYDQRLYASQNWWKEILSRLDWCEGFVYLLSPDSVQSDYCRREFEIARSLGRHIFPVLIHPDTQIPEALRELHYVDLSQGVTPEAVKALLDGIYKAESSRREAEYGMDLNSMSRSQVAPPIVDDARIITLAAEAMEEGHYDQAVFFLGQAKARGYKSRHINLDALLAEAGAALERLSYLRDAERDYKVIADLIRLSATRKLGCESLRSFLRDFPTYDPDGLRAQCESQGMPMDPVPADAGASPHALRGEPAPDVSAAPLGHTVFDRPGGGQTLIQPPQPRPSLPMLEWVQVPGGDLRVESDAARSVGPALYVDSFSMAKYPVTNAQYQVFLDDPQGYANTEWWDYAPEACAWRDEHPQPEPSAYKGENRPREMVNWYDAVAFTRWLSAYLGVRVTLPTLEQRQRAVQGDDERAYPWGDAFDKARCNTRESELKMTTTVDRYEDGKSPYGIYDLVGNVWEWCLNTESGADGPLALTGSAKRIVHGGAFVSPSTRCQVAFYYALNPNTLYASIGFRVVRL